MRHFGPPALIAATRLKPLSVVAAQNVLLIAYVFANMAAMYALAWDILSTTINAEPAEHAEDTDLRGFSELGVVRRGSVLAAVIFGLSPYFASHLLGHFDFARCVLPAAVCVDGAAGSGDGLPQGGTVRRRALTRRLDAVGPVRRLQRSTV